MEVKGRGRGRRMIEDKGEERKGGMRIWSIRERARDGGKKV